MVEPESFFAARVLTSDAEGFVLIFPYTQDGEHVTVSDLFHAARKSNVPSVKFATAMDIPELGVTVTADGMPQYVRILDIVHPHFLYVHHIATQRLHIVSEDGRGEWDIDVPLRAGTFRGDDMYSELGRQTPLTPHSTQLMSLKLSFLPVSRSTVLTEAEYGNVFLLQTNTAMPGGSGLKQKPVKRRRSSVATRKTRRNRSRSRTRRLK